MQPLYRDEKTPRRTEVRTIIRGGQRIHSSHFTAIWAITSIKNREPKLSLVIGASVGPSVVRNHTKRVIREVFHHVQARLIKGIAVVILARADLTTLTRSELRSSLEALFERLIKLQPSPSSPGSLGPPSTSSASSRVSS